MRNLASGDLTCTEREGLMLRKWVINDWVYVCSGLMLKDRGGCKMTCTCLRGFLFGSRFKCRKMGWPSHRKKNFFKNDSVGLSMLDCLIETVKYIWVNISCMLDWILSQNCRNTLPLHSSWTTSYCKSAKT